MVTVIAPTELSPTPFTVTSFAVIVSAPNCEEPINPVNKTFPAPAVKVRSRGVASLSRVSPNVMSLPTLPPLVMVTLLVSNTAVANPIPPTDVMLPPIEFKPDPI